MGKASPAPSADVSVGERPATWYAGDPEKMRLCRAGGCWSPGRLAHLAQRPLSLISTHWPRLPWWPWCWSSSLKSYFPSHMPVRPTSSLECTCMTWYSLYWSPGSISPYGHTPADLSKMQSLLKTSPWLPIKSTHLNLPFQADPHLPFPPPSLLPDCPLSQEAAFHLHTLRRAPAGPSPSSR